MPADANDIIEDVLAVPLPLLLSLTAQGVAEAQTALDESSISVQERLDELTAVSPDDSGLGRYQLEANWYHIPEVTVDIKMSVAMKLRTQTRSDGRKVVRPSVVAAPLNARSQQLASVSAEGTSQLRARIVSIPAAERRS